MPSNGRCTVPLTLLGKGRPAASRTVGAMSVTWVNCERISPLRLDALRPVDDDAVGGAAVVRGDLLGPLEGSVAGPGPADGVVGEGGGVAPFVEVGHVDCGGVDDSVEGHHFVVGALGAAFGAGAVVADDVDEEGVVEDAHRFRGR